MHAPGAEAAAQVGRGRRGHRRRAGDRCLRAPGGARRRRGRHPRRDRRRARDQCRGLREVVHPEGRPVGVDDSRLSASFMTPGTSSFAEFLASQSPDLLPSRHAVPQGHAGDLAPHGTTIVAATFPGGVVMAGDRRATMGNIIAQRDIQKVFPADEYSAVGIAGTAGIAVEMVRLFQVELEHYEKIEGTTLSMDGKANRLSALIRGNLAMAMQGLAVVPLFAGFDLENGQGRIFSYDVTGGRYEETAFHSVGSGSLFARGALKKLYRPDLELQGAVEVVVQALYDAADDDSATGGPDLTRRIFPVVQVISVEGGRRLPDDEVAEVADRVIAARMTRPDGPAAPLTTGSNGGGQA